MIITEVKKPAVSIVIAVHNDVTHLRDAIGSAQRQTLRSLEIIVVDDCSTDGSAGLARRMAKKDGRIRVFQTVKNSGGAGGPRNLGVRQARGEWLTFLDSDDRLDRHATKNLLRAGISDKSDLVCGQTRRYSVERESWAGWHPKLYIESKYIADIDEYVELLIDSNSTAKLFSRDFIERIQLEFPEDIHYEDLVYSSNAYSQAAGISIIPEVVYVWKIYPVHERKSITNQRDSLQNLLHRIEAIERIEKSVLPNASRAVVDRFYLKFLRHDARLYLNDAVRNGDDQVISTTKLLEPLVRRVPSNVFDLVEPGERVLYAAALGHSPRNVRLAVLMAKKEVSIAGTAECGQTLGTIWAGDPKAAPWPSDPLMDWLRDLSQTRIASTPWFQFKFHHQCLSAYVDDHKRLTIRGITYDPFELIRSRQNVVFEVLASTRGRNSLSATSSVVVTSNVHGQFSWESSVDLPKGVPLTGKVKINLQFRVRYRELSNLGSIWSFSSSTTPEPIAGSGLLANLLCDRYQLRTTKQGRLMLRQVPTTSKRIRLRQMLIRPVRFQRSMSRRFSGRINPTTTAWRLAYAMMRLTPLRAKRALFESNMGKTISDSPGAIYKELRRLRPDVETIWSLEAGADLPVTSKTVLRGSLKYLWAMSTAKYIVDNQSLPMYFRKRRGQVYVQTWHGIPLKKMGFDEPRISKGLSRVRKELASTVASWDFLTVPSEYFRRTFIDAYRYSGRELRGGTPRNDVLVQPTTSKADICAKLGIPTDRKVVVYAPTFRASSLGSRSPLRPQLDLESWSLSMSEDVVLLVRAHYLNKFNIPPHIAGNVVDVSQVDDISDLYQIADLLITDYSSVMFDFSILDRPICLYLYDYSEYVNNERGTYFDILKQSPGSVAFDQEVLHENVRTSLFCDTGSEIRRKFRDDFVGPESGRASIDTVLTVWGK